MTRDQTQSLETPNPPPGRARRFMMPMVVFGLLGGHVVFIFLAITLATGDRSFAVVPDYYQKAVDFDAHKAALRESAALGWRVEVQPGKAVDAAGEREAVLVLRDGEGAPVTGAAVAVSCYHYARAGEVVGFALGEVVPGQYAGRAKLAKGGFWQFEVAITRGDERFVAEFKQFVPEAEAAR